MHSELHSVLCNVFLRVKAANCGCVCVHGPITGEMAARQLRGHCPLRSAFAFKHQHSVRIFSVENGYFKWCLKDIISLSRLEDDVEWLLKLMKYRRIVWVRHVFSIFHMTYGNALLYFKLGDCSYFLNKVGISNVSKNSTSVCGFLRLLVTRQDNFPGLSLPDKTVYYLLWYNGGLPGFFLLTFRLLTLQKRNAIFIDKTL